jgi:hypothetical protein
MSQEILSVETERRKRGRRFGSRNDRSIGTEGPNLSREGAARYLGYSIAALKAFATKGGGPPYCQVGKRGKIIYRVADLDAWLASSLKQSTADAA